MKVLINKNASFRAHILNIRWLLSIPTPHAGCSRTAFHHHANIRPIRMTDNEQWAKWLFWHYRIVMMQYHHDGILKGQLFGRVDREMCLLWLFFSRAAWMFLQLSSGRRRWAWRPPERIGTTLMKMSLAASPNDSEWLLHWGSRFLRNRAKFYWHNSTVTLARFVMYITRCTGTSSFMYINCLCTSRALFYYRAKFYWHNSTVTLARFVMYITCCTGTSFLCKSIVFVHHTPYFINTTAILLCLRKIDTSILLCT